MKTIHKLGRIYLTDSVTIKDLKHEIGILEDQNVSNILISFKTDILSSQEYLEMYSEKNNWVHGVIDYGLIEIHM